MKIYWILIGFVAPFTVANNFTRTTFASCNPNEWIIMNTTVDWNDTIKQIEGNISYVQGTDRPIYTIHIEIDDCSNGTSCLGEPLVWVDYVNCTDTNLNTTNLDACRAAQEIARLEKEEEWLLKRYGEEFNFCIALDDISFYDSMESDESNSNETNSE